MTVSDLLAQMSSSEFSEWIAYFTIKSEEAQEAQSKHKSLR